MSGPRLQASLIEGCENTAHTIKRYAGGFGIGEESYTKSSDTGSSQYRFGSSVVIGDRYDGRQTINPADMPSSGEFHAVGIKYALKTTTPGMYLVIALYETTTSGTERPNGAAVFRHQVGDGAFDYSQAQTLTTTQLPLSSWKNLLGGNPTSVARTNSGCYYTTIEKDVAALKWAKNNRNALQYERTSGGYYSQTVADNNITLTFEFPANASFLTYTGDSTNGSCNIFPLDMTTKKYGTYLDCIKPRTESYDFIAKVWSPAKNCFCLKNLENGEIPILNE